MKECCINTIKELEYVTDSGVSCCCGNHWDADEFEIAKKKVLM